MAPRTRSFPFSSGGDVLGTYRGVPQVRTTYVGLQSCTDETHPGPPYRSGGPLTVTKKRVTFRDSQTISVCSNPGASPPFRYVGRMAVLPYFPTVEPTRRSLAGWGAIGWNRTFPLHPVYSMGVSIFELKDLHGMVSQTMQTFSDLAKRGFRFTATRRTFGDFLNDVKKGPKYLADNYLNTTFGWIPFAQDLAAAFAYRDKLLKKLRWLRNHNRRSVRRKITLDAGGFTEAIPSTATSPVALMGPNTGNSLLYSSGNSPVPIDQTKSYDSKIWYVARYRFHIPELDHGSLFLDKHRRLSFSLYGIDFDPSIIYKVIPWSWLLDWFLNVGAVLQNIYFRARYQVVADYAYVMCSEKYTYIRRSSINMHSGDRNVTTGVYSGPDVRCYAEAKTQYIFRQRVEANPYGFGITFASLSAYQWSILAALGLSRRGKHSAPRA